MKLGKTTLKLKYAIKTLLLVTFLLTFGVLQVYAMTSGQQLWAKRYNGPGSNFDTANDIAIDSNNNVYVAGTIYGSSSTDYDFVTMKYDSVGNQKWVRRYNGTGNYTDIANAIAIDKNNNVYIAGKSSSKTSGFNYAVIKYSPAGNQLWLKTFNGPGNRSDTASDIAIDSNNNVYVAGASYGGSSSSYDYAIIKYDGNGKKLWDKRYNGSGSRSDIANAIAIDKNNNVYITGWSYGGSETNRDYATIKYDSSGNRKWIKRYNGPGNRFDEARAIAIDKNNNVYITGWSYGGSETNRDYATIKYDSSGNRKWIKRYNGPGNGFDEARAIAIDKNNNVYITGWSYGFLTKSDYTTIKYDSDGNQKWARRYNGTGNGYDIAKAIAIDSKYNVFVAGNSLSGWTTGDDYALVKYDSGGTRIWVRRYNGLGNCYDGINALAIDKNNNVYITGTSYAGQLTGRDIVTIKYAP